MFRGGICSFVKKFNIGLTGMTLQLTQPLYILMISHPDP